MVDGVELPTNSLTLVDEYESVGITEPHYSEICPTVTVVKAKLGDDYVIWWRKGLVQDIVPDCVRIVLVLHDDIEVVPRISHDKFVQRRRGEYKLSKVTSLGAPHLLSFIKDGLEIRTRFNNVNLDNRGSLERALRVRNQE